MSSEPDVKPPRSLAALMERARTAAAADDPALHRLAGDLAVATRRGDLPTLRALRAALAAADSAPDYVHGYRRALADVAAAMEREIVAIKAEEELPVWVRRRARAVETLTLMQTVPRSAPDMAAHFGISPSTARDLLRDLEAFGLVEGRGEHPVRYAPTLRAEAVLRRLTADGRRG